MSSWHLTTEFNFFKASVAFQNDPKICTPALDIVMANGAHSPCYYGKQIEDPTTGYNFVHWDSYQAHMDVTDNPEIFPKLQEALKSSLDGKPTMSHVIFSGTPIALDQPFTQVTKLTLKTPFPENRNKVGAILSEIARKIGTQFVFGPTYEDGNEYIVICGQTSEKGLWDVTSNPELLALIKDLFGRANKDFDIHTTLLRAKAGH